MWKYTGRSWERVRHIVKKALLMVVVAIAFGVRLAYLLHSHPFFDEFSTVLAARSILQEGVPVLPSGLFYEHGLLFSYLDTPFVGLAGWSRLEAGNKGLFLLARLPSLVFGVVSVPILYWVGKRWFSAWAGLGAAVLLALSPEGMVWGGRARMYALAQLLALLLALLVYEGSYGKGRPRLRWLAYLVLLLALLNQFGSLILVPPLLTGGLVVGWVTRPGGERPWFFKTAVLVEGACVACVLVLGVLVKRLGQPLGAARLGSQSSDGPLLELWNTISYQAGLVWDAESAVQLVARQFGVPHHIWLAVVAVLGGLAALLSWLLLRRSKRKAGETGPSLVATVYLWLIVTLPMMEMVLLLEPWRRNPRYLVMILPWFYLLVVAGLSHVYNIRCYLVKPAWKRVFTIGFILLVVGLAGVQLRGLWIDGSIAYRTPEPAYEEAFSYVAEEQRVGDVVLTMNTSAGGLYLDEVDYFAVQEDAAQFLLDADTRPVDRWLGAPWVGSAVDFNRVLNEHERAWFVVDTIRLPVYYRGDWLAVLNTQMDLVWSGDEALVFQTREDRQPLPDHPRVSLKANLGGEIELEGFDDGLGSGTVRKASEVYPLTLFWRALTPATQDYTVFVHVRDGQGSVVAQHDAQPVAGEYPTSQWREGETVIDSQFLQLPPDLASGEYQVWVGMYRLETLERLLVENDVSGENAVWLDTIVVGE